MFSYFKILTYIYIFLFFNSIFLFISLLIAMYRNKKKKFKKKIIKIIKKLNIMFLILIFFLYFFSNCRDYIFNIIFSQKLYKYLDIIFNFRTEISNNKNIIIPINIKSIKKTVKLFKDIISF